MVRKFVADTKPRVIVIGDSIVRRAACYLLSHAPYMDLGLSADVVWKGRGGRRLSHMQQVLEGIKSSGLQDPDVIVLACGGNDVGVSGDLYMLRHMARTVITRTNKLFPRAVIVWSDIVPRHHWQYMGCQKAAAKVRRKVNATAGKVVKGLGGVTVTHPLIRWDDLSCYRLAVNDPVHLSNKGLHLLCTAWAQAVRELL